MQYQELVYRICTSIVSVESYSTSYLHSVKYLSNELHFKMHT